MALWPDAQGKILLSLFALYSCGTYRICLSQIFGNRHCGPTEISGIDSAGPADLDGYVGYRFFESHRVRFDFPDRQLFIEPDKRSSKQ